jgi:small subunit ribosomal protein S14
MNSWTGRLLTVVTNALTTPTRQLHRLEVAGKGHSYKTQIVRKRQVRDHNLPVSLDPGQSESLKWTDWKMFKDLKNRHVVSLNFPTRISLLSLYRSPLLPQALREQALQDLMHTLPRASTWARLRNRCVITSRKRGNIRNYWVSRFIFRQLADYNKLSGVIKSKWGP